MNSSPRSRTLRVTGSVAVLCAALLAGSVSAQTPSPSRPIDDHTALRLALQHSPTLRAAVLELEGTTLAVKLEEGRFPYTLQLDSGATRMAQPGATNGSVEVSKSETYEAGAQVSKTFPAGTRASVRLEGYRDLRRSPVESGPNYGGVAKATVAQPLLRGAGQDVVEEQLRIARLTRSVSELSRDRVASELVRDVLLAYWELWYAQQAVEIEESALALAKQQRDEAAERVDKGALAPVELLPFETRVASLEEGLVSAQTERRRRELNLVQRMGGATTETQTSLTASASPRDPEPMPPRTTMMQLTLSNSPDIAELSAQVRLAEERLRSSGDAYRARLDVEGYVQLAGLGHREVSPVFDQLATARATSVHVGLVYELPLGDSRKDNQQARDSINVKVAAQRLLATRQRLQTELDTLLQQEQAARTRLSLSTKTSEIAKQLLDAETERFQMGVAISLQVREAEDQWRQAKLRALRAKVDVTTLEIQRRHATGDLLRELTPQVSSQNPQSTLTK